MYCGCFARVLDAVAWALPREVEVVDAGWQILHAYVSQFEDHKTPSPERRGQGWMWGMGAPDSTK